MRRPWIRNISTHVSLVAEILQLMKERFSPREFVVNANTISQVNFRTKLIQGISILPEGFTEQYSVLNPDQDRTLKNE